VAAQHAEIDGKVGPIAPFDRIASFERTPL
jgi:hypothetical protein